ncbi:MAG: DedA family protein [Gammaproteobacteria bacterium]|nr:DedA family protein [Gammaproteobacteria bacterium]
MDASLWSLFASAFLSSTLLPGGSEAVLAYLASNETHGYIILLFVAAAGNTLGGMTSWGLGWLIAVKYPARGLVKPAQQQAVVRIQRWGSPVLLLSWLPLLGDPLCVAAGWLRMHWLVSLLFIGGGKTARYAALLYWLD